ncbi:MAG: MbtH family protein [Acidobacteriota bacterium]
MSDDDRQKFLVVVNEEEAYSLWPEAREIPAGWREVLGASAKQECLDFIEAAWTEMRPQSLRDGS